MPAFSGLVGFIIVAAVIVLCVIVGLALAGEINLGR